MGEPSARVSSDGTSCSCDDATKLVGCFSRASYLVGEASRPAGITHDGRAVTSSVGHIAHVQGFAAIIGETVAHHSRYLVCVGCGYAHSIG